MAATSQPAMDQPSSADRSRAAPRLAAPPPPVRVAAPHPHAALLHALSLALGALQASESAAPARALAGIDFDLPAGTPSAADRGLLLAAAPLYFASQLELAGLLPAAETIAGLFVAGTVQAPLGPSAGLLHAFWRARRERLSVDERAAIFARVIEPPHFDRLMRALCEVLAAQADGADLREQVLAASHAESLASFLVQRVDPMAAIAARDIIESINTALVFLRDRSLQSAFGVSDLWRLVGLATHDGDARALPSPSIVDRGRSGQSLLLWLADHYAERSIALDPGDPADRRVLIDAQRWLAATPPESTPRPAQVGAALPLRV
jgi:hypothetical protein